MVSFIPINNLQDVPQFEVDKFPVFDQSGQKIPGAFSLQRTDDNTHLGMVGDRYRPIQMEEMVDIINSASNKIGGIDHKGFTLSKGGRKVIIQSKLEENIKLDDEVIEPYFYTVIDNSGLGANKVIPSTIRIACDNAFHLIRDFQNKNNRALHSSSFNNKILSMVDNITQSINTVKNFTLIIEKLRNSKFTKDEMIQLTQKVYPIKNNETQKSVNKREEIVELFERGRGNSGQNRWDAFNAITEFETHRGKQSTEKLIRSLTMPTASRNALKILTTN